MTFPENLIDRQKYYMDQIKAGNFEMYWAEVKSTLGAHEAIFNVFSDDLKINGVRINVSAKGQQEIADYMSCSLLTAKLSDMIFMKAKWKLTPAPRTISSSVAVMTAHSVDIDKQVNKVGAAKNDLVSTVGKDWIIDNILANKPIGTAMNYGWHFKGNSFQGITGELPVGYKDMPGIRMIQGRGTRHDNMHSDYSQVCRLVSNSLLLDGKVYNLQDLLSEDLAALGNYDGKLKYLRQI